MQFFQPLFDFDQTESVSPGTRLALAVGVFDGVHAGHRQIIKTVRTMADQSGSKACAVTFSPHPRSLFGSAPQLLVSEHIRRKLLLSAGADITGTIKFDQETAQLAPEDFLERLLRDDRFELAGICVGEHWHFGNRGSGGRELIEKFAEKYDFKFCAVPELNDGEDIISSTLIRKLLEQGELKRAERLLCSRICLSGKVVHGFGVASKELSAPTANLDVEYGVIPPNGVYACFAEIDGIVHQAAANIGVAPTFSVGKRRVEVHLLDSSENLYDKTVNLEIVDFIRSEKKFNSADELKRQIFSDIEKIKLILSEKR